MIVSRLEGTTWPPGTHTVEHNGVELYLIPVVDGIEIDTVHRFHVDWSPSNEQFEITFFEFQEPRTE